jgi:hypothetical protein
MANNALLAVRRRLKASLSVLGMLALFCLPARAANNCPWLNEATASGLIGCDSVGAFTPAPDAHGGACTFTEKADGTARTLTIAIEVVADPHARVSALAQSCGGGADPLNAIGNEAFDCSADVRRGQLGERVVGRVRNQVFTITLSSTMKDDPILTRNALQSRIYTAAEQVAGNLF